MENIIIECSCQSDSIWSIILGIAPIVVAIAAIIAPCIIAAKQNKIALYEIRFDCYQQLESMRAFCEYLKNITTFSPSEDEQTDRVWSCQLHYFNAHSLLEDEEFQRKKYDAFYQKMYANFCLQADQKMFLSLKLLIGSNEKEVELLSKASELLCVFIKKLFRSYDATQKDLENKLSDLDSAKSDLILAFGKIEEIEKKLEKLLKL